MEISQAKGEDVAAPGGIVSGAAGTGQEQKSAHVPGKGRTGSKTGQECRDRIVIGLGVLAPATKGGAADPAPGRAATAPEDCRTGGEETDPVFALCERDERIAERLTRKIVRLEKKLARIEERGRSP